MVPHSKVLRSPSSGQPSCQPAAGATQAVTLSADPLAGCHFAPDKGNVSLNAPSGCPRFRSPAAFRCCQRPVWLCDVLSVNGDESTSHIQTGRRALVSPGRRSLAALAVSRRGPLFSPRHAAGAVLACVRPASSVSSRVAVVAAVRARLPVSHRLVAPPVSKINSDATCNSPWLHRASPSFRSGPGEAPTRRSVWIGTVPPAAWPDSPVCRLSIPLHCNCASYVSVPLHFEVVKSDETG